MSEQQRDVQRVISELRAHVVRNKRPKVMVQREHLVMLLNVLDPLPIEAAPDAQKAGV